MGGNDEQRLGVFRLGGLHFLRIGPSRHIGNLVVLSDGHRLRARAICAERSMVDCRYLAIAVTEVSVAWLIKKDSGQPKDLKVALMT